MLRVIFNYDTLTWDVEDVRNGWQVSVLCRCNSKEEAQRQLKYYNEHNG